MSDHPPKGYRPAIPMATKFGVVMRQNGKCTRCGKKLGEWSETQFDHNPALQLRGWSEEAKDTVPAANDTNAIDAVHKDCHLKKTTGRQGESDLSKRGGDVSEIAKLRRVEKKHKEFRDRLLTKSEESMDLAEAPKYGKVKKKWPSRPWPKKGKPRDHSQEE